MQKFVWDEKYSVAIPSIDDQHKNFFGITNSLLDVSARGEAGKDELMALLTHLADYALYHFNTEEEYFDEYGYESKMEHIADHNLFRDKVKYYFEEAEKKDADMPRLLEEVMTYSVHWLSNHILEMDRHYSKFLISKGIE